MGMLQIDLIGAWRCSQVGILKIDLLADEAQAPVGRIPAAHLSASTFFGEPFFVPRDAAAAATGTAAEDDGFLIVFATDAASLTSQCLVRCPPTSLDSCSVVRL